MYNVPGFDHFESEILVALRRVKNHDLEDMVYKTELPYDENMDVLDKTYNSATSIGCTLLPGVYKSSDNNLMLKSLLPDEVTVNITIDDIRLNRSSLSTKKLIRFNENFFLYTILDFT